MDRFLAAIVSQLPSTLAGSHVQRQASFFGRFVERLLYSSDKDEEQELFMQTMNDCLEVVSKEDYLIKDPKLGLLRGLVLTITFIALVHPENLSIKPAQTWADIMGGRIALLTTSKLAGNILVYTLAMNTFSSYLGNEPMLIFGNTIQKMLQSSKTLVIVEGLKAIRLNTSEIVIGIGLESTLRLVRHGESIVRSNAWRTIISIENYDSLLLTEVQKEFLVETFLVEKNLDVIDSAILWVGEALNHPPTTTTTTKRELIIEDCKDILNYILENDIVKYHIVLFCRLLNLSLLLSSSTQIWTVEIFTKLFRMTRVSSIEWSILWLKVEQSGHFDKLLAEQQIELIKGFIRADDLNIVYSGLKILKKTILGLSSHILTFQQDLGTLVKHEDPQISHLVMEIFFSMSNTENWESILEVALYDRIKYPCTMEEHLLYIIIIKAALKTTLKYSKEDNPSVIVKILNLVPERATMVEIEDINRCLLCLPVSCEVSEDLGFNRMMLYSNIFNGKFYRDENVLRRKLLDIEGNPLIESNDPRITFRKSLFDNSGKSYGTFPPTTFPSPNSSPEISNQNSTAALLPKVINDIFAGVAKLPPPTHHPNE